LATNSSVSSGRISVTLAERVLYHQIHPAKLLVDWTAGLVAAGLLWRHHLIAAPVVGLLPPFVASALLLSGRFDQDLLRYQASEFGRYVARHMTRAMEALRLVGLVVLWVGSWHRSLSLAALGVLIVLAAWVRGWWSPSART
jgi:hypothetical protein